MRKMQSVRVLLATPAMRRIRHSNVWGGDGGGVESGWLGGNRLRECEKHSGSPRPLVDIVAIRIG